MKKMSIPLALGNKPMLEWINISELRIDRANYQRPANDKKVKKLAATWDWNRVEVLSVAIRDTDDEDNDGYWIFEGQHRYLAAIERGDIDQLPCAIFYHSTVEREANSFLGINNNRSRLAQVDQFRTLVAQNDPTVLAIATMLSLTGHEVSQGTSPSCVRFAGRLLRLARISMVTLKTVWPVVAECAKRANAMPTSDLLVVFFKLERVLISGQTLGTMYWRERIAEIGYNVLRSRFRQSVSGMSTSAAKFDLSVRPILPLLNQNLKNNRLVIDEEKVKKYHNTSI